MSAYRPAVDGSGTRVHRRTVQVSTVDQTDDGTAPGPREVVIEVQHSLDLSTGATRIRPCGEIDMAVADRLQQVVIAHLANGAVRVVVDLGDVTFLDSSGIRPLLTAPVRDGAPAVDEGREPQVDGADSSRDRRCHQPADRGAGMRLRHHRAHLDLGSLENLRASGCWLERRASPFGAGEARRPRVAGSARNAQPGPSDLTGRPLGQIIPY